MARYLFLLILIVAGCGPVRVTVGLVDAERAVQEARDAGAEDHAVYPLTLAEQLLAKAIEERGYAEWEQAFVFANEAVKHANEATALCKDVTPAPLWPGSEEALDADAEEAPESEEAPDADDAAREDPAPQEKKPAYYDLPPEGEDDDPEEDEPVPGDDDDSAAGGEEDEEEEDLEALDDEEADEDSPWTID